MRRLVGLALAMMALLAACTVASSTPISSPSGAGTGTPGPTLSGPPPQISGTVTAGPVCPVERNPPDPACAPRPVAGAVIVATGADGTELARTTTADDGTYTLVVTQTGTITVTGEPLTGYMGAPKPETVELTEPGQVVRLDLAYDTGIR